MFDADTFHEIASLQRRVDQLERRVDQLEKLIDEILDRLDEEEQQTDQEKELARIREIDATIQRMGENSTQQKLAKKWAEDQKP